MVLLATFLALISKVPSTVDPVKFLFPLRRAIVKLPAVFPAFVLSPYADNLN